MYRFIMPPVFRFTDGLQLTLGDSKVPQARLDQGNWRALYIALVTLGRLNVSQQENGPMLGRMCPTIAAKENKLPVPSNA